jgi:TonB family protein
VRVLFLLLLLVSSAALAQSDGGTGVLTRAPALLKQVEAVFPLQMLDAGTGGRVVMEVDLGADGTVTAARVVESAGQAFDDAALAAVKQFTFSPAEVDGVPAAVRLQYAYEFFFRPQVVEVAPAPDAGPVVNFDGRVLERGTRDPISGATVILGEGEAAREAFPDEKGAFGFTDVPVGNFRVVVTAPDYERYQVREDFAEGKKTVVTYFARKTVYGNYETLVRAQREKKEVAQVNLKQEEIRLIPGTQGDAFKVVQNLPGVARSPFGIGLLVVRGSKPYDTRTYVDEAPVPLLFHFGGIKATYNSELLEELDFQQGNFGAPYGRNIGGLVRATSRSPSHKGFHGYVDVNLADASALVEFPIGEEFSVAASARRSYIDALLPAIFDLFVPQAKDALTFAVAPRYYDYQVKAEWKQKGGRHRVFFSFFGSDDALKFLLPNASLDPEGRGEFGSTIQYNRWLLGYDFRVSPQVRFTSRNSFGYDQLTITGGSDLFAKGTQFPLLLRQRLNIDLPQAFLELELGAELGVNTVVSEVQRPPNPSPNEIPDPFVSRQLELDKATNVYVEPAAWVNLAFTPHETFKAVGGLRIDHNSVMQDGWVDPCLGLFWNPWKPLTFKAGAGLYHQMPDYRQGLLSPTTGNPDLLPEQAAHYMVGAEVRFTDFLSLDVQGYYKSLTQQVRTTFALGGEADLSSEGLDLRYQSTGIGRAYGLEVLLRYSLTKNFFGWVSYTLSRSERDYNNGRRIGLSPLDQPHNLVALASYKLPFDFIIGAKIRYTTGALSTPVQGALYDVNGNYYFPIFGDSWSKRLPDFFQLDVRIDKRFVFRDWMLSLYLDVQNVTNRRNVEGVLNNFDFSRSQYIYGMPILPILGVRGEW